MKYFLHDTSALDDEKIAELFMRFSYEGIGLFYCLLEKIAKQEKPVKTMVLKKQLKVGKKLDKIWQFMEEIGLICSNNGETFNKQLLNYSEKYKEKKINNAKRLSEWREKQALTENETSSENVRNASNSIVEYSNNNIYMSASPTGEQTEKKVPVNKLIETFDDRKEAFRLSLYPYTKFGKNPEGIYTSEMVKAFFNHFSEPNKSRSKMRWEMEKTWDLGLRLNRWSSNSLNLKNKNNSKIGVVDQSENAKLFDV